MQVDNAWIGIATAPVSVKQSLSSLVLTTPGTSLSTLEAKQTVLVNASNQSLFSLCSQSDDHYNDLPTIIKN